MRSRLDFLSAAVAEAQATIRALDVKLAALLVAALVPVPLLASIAECFAGIYKAWGNDFVGITLIVFCCAWSLSIVCFSLAIGAISSPAARVRSAASYTGSLFSPGLYRFTLLDALANRDAVLSQLEPSAHLQRLPSAEAEIESELSFEHLKLIYIRDIKLLRLRWGFRFAASASVIGAVLYAIGRYHLKQCGP
jgi:hypothetical protein